MYYEPPDNMWELARDLAVIVHKQSGFYPLMLGIELW